MSTGGGAALPTRRGSGAEAEVVRERYAAVRGAV